MLDIGTSSCTSGMSQTIYNSMYNYLYLSFANQLSGSSDNQNKIQEQMKLMAFAMSEGVINHLLSATEVQIIDNNVIETYVAGAGDKGGNLIAGGLYPVVGSINRVQTLTGTIL